MTGYPFTTLLLGIVTLPLLLCAACAPSTQNAAGYVRRTTSAANDHIMLVRHAPPTFGFQRLSALSTVYPDLGLFLSEEGFPEFLAETNKGKNRYLILYYINSRKAFACRSGEGKSRQVEFSGPYPVTEKEVSTLQDLREKAGTAH